MHRFVGDILFFFLCKLLWLPSVASQTVVCSAPLQGAVRSTMKCCRLSGSSKSVQLRAARPFGVLDNLTDKCSTTGGGGGGGGMHGR